VELGNYSPTGRNPNTTWVREGNLTRYYSYETVVAFDHPETGLVVCKNIWSRTTGKHLNWIGGHKKDRLKRHVFTAMLDNLIKNGRVQEPIKSDGIRSLRIREAMQSIAQ
jgi:hypothetical protein